MARRRKILGIGIGGFLMLFAILYLFPYVWMTSMSLKPDAEIYSTNIFPENPTLEQYRRLFYGYEFKGRTLEINFPAYYKNTVIITLISLVLVILPMPWQLMGLLSLSFAGRPSFSG